MANSVSELYPRSRHRDQPCFRSIAFTFSLDPQICVEFILPCFIIPLRISHYEEFSLCITNVRLTSKVHDGTEISCSTV